MSVVSQQQVVHPDQPAQGAAPTASAIPAAFSAAIERSLRAMAPAAEQVVEHSSALIKDYISVAFGSDIICDNPDEANASYSFTVDWTDAKTGKTGSKDVTILLKDLIQLTPEQLQELSNFVALPASSYGITARVDIADGYQKFVEQQLKPLSDEWYENPNKGTWAYSLIAPGREPLPICSHAPLNAEVIKEAQELGFEIEKISTKQVLSSWNAEPVGVWWDESRLPHARFVTVNGERLLVSPIDGVFPDGLGKIPDQDPESSESILGWQKKNLTYQLASSAKLSNFEISVEPDLSAGLEGTKVRIVQKLDAPLNIGDGQVSEYVYEFEFGHADLSGVAAGIDLEEQLLLAKSSMENFLSEFATSDSYGKERLLKGFLDTVYNSPIDVFLNLTHDGGRLYEPKSPVVDSKPVESTAENSAPASSEEANTSSVDINSANPEGSTVDQELDIATMNAELTARMGKLAVTPEYKRLSAYEHHVENFIASIDNAFFPDERAAKVFSRLDSSVLEAVSALRQSFEEIRARVEYLRGRCQSDGNVPDAHWLEKFYETCETDSRAQRYLLRDVLKEIEGIEDIRYRPGLENKDFLDDLEPMAFVLDAKSSSFSGLKEIGANVSSYFSKLAKYFSDLGLD